MEFSKTNYIFIISDFPATFEALGGSANFSRFPIWLIILPFLAKITMWGIFPTQLLSLNPILLWESKNSKNSGIFWNLWNFSTNMTYLAFLPKQDLSLIHI